MSRFIKIGKSNRKSAPRKKATGLPRWPFWSERTLHRLMGQSKWDDELQSEMKEIEKRLLKEKQNRDKKNKDIEVPMRYHFNAAVSNEGILYTW